MTTEHRQFTAFSRLLHWTMAAMILTMLCIGVAMVTSLGNYHLLLSIHRPLGIAILLLVVVRFVNRQLSSLPPFPATMSRLERLAAKASELTMYGLMFVLPLVGWGMLSAARYPIVLYGSLHLPYILPHNTMLYAVLRQAHTILAYFFFLTFLAHFGAILFHTLIVKDGILKRMAPWNIRSQPATERRSPPPSPNWWRPSVGGKELTMNPSDIVEADLVTLPSAHSATETVERLKALLSQKKIQVFADIDHAAGAQKVGLPLRPTHLLIFGNPQVGTPLMQSQQTIGLDLPLRVLVWEDAAGKVWLSYHRLEFLAQFHQVLDHDEIVKALSTGLAALTRGAAAP